MIIKNKQPSEVSFECLNGGDVFKHADQYFLKLNSVAIVTATNCFRLYDGRTYSFRDDLQVEKIKGVFVEE